MHEPQRLSAERLAEIERNGFPSHRDTLDLLVHVAAVERDGARLAAAIERYAPTDAEPHGEWDGCPDCGMWVAHGLPLIHIAECRRLQARAAMGAATGAPG